MGKYYWLKLMNDFFTQPKIKKLRKIAGGDTYTIIYLKMQLLSLKNDGKLYFENIENNFIEEVALTIDEDVDNVAVTVQYLQSQGLIETSDDFEYLMTETQSLIGSESDSKDRVRAYRERKKQREKIPLQLVSKISNEQILLPDGTSKFIDNKRYGGNAEYVYELAMCKCECCGETDSSKLLIHHNNGYSNDLDDLYLLCKKCHSNVENGNITELKHNRKSVTCNTHVTECNTEKRREELDTDIELKKEKKKKPIRHKYGEYKNVLLSDEDYQKLIDEFPDDYESRIEKLSEYMASTGKSYKNHLATIRNWARREKENANIGKDKQTKRTGERHTDEDYTAGYEYLFNK